MVRAEIRNLRSRLSRDRPAQRQAASLSSLGMWRYADLLPAERPVSLAEGWTPLVQSGQTDGIFLKEEGRNPGGTVEARAASVMMSVAAGLAPRALVTGHQDTTAVLCAYAARAGIWLEAGHLPPAAEQKLPCLVHAASQPQQGSSSDEYETRIPFAELAHYRMAGLKTVGYEIAEQLGWEMPARVICAEGDGALRAALVEAFEDLHEFEWMSGGSPEIYGAVVQDAVRELAENEVGEHRLTVTQAEVAESIRIWARDTGLLLSLSGGAAAAAAAQLGRNGSASARGPVVVVNSENALQHADALLSLLQIRGRMPLPASLPVGGIITPI